MDEHFGKLLRCIQGEQQLGKYKKSMEESLFGGELSLFVKKAELLQSCTKILQSGTAFCYQKVGQLLLQSGTGSFITKWDNCYYKVGLVLLLQSGTTAITKWNGYYKVGQLLQSGP